MYYFSTDHVTDSAASAIAAHHVFPNQSSVMTNYGSTPDPSESFVSSDTCPETPDSSVKEEGDVNSPDTGSYTCLWQDCHEEFVTQKALVDHISENHMGSQKGCEEFPCMWKVNNKVIIKKNPVVSIDCRCGTVVTDFDWEAKTR